MLGEEYPAFLKSCECGRYQAVRMNPLKTKREEMRSLIPYAGSAVAWEPDGFYYRGEDARPGKHPYHEAGVYYIQEPSAMLPARLLDAQPGERILDLCAAPGGKSTQLGAAMCGEGILICNEIHPARAKILSENVERMGVANAIVTNETPQRLRDYFTGYFDKILVDAPCSGEGMFRKNSNAAEEWSVENVKMCAGRQDEILDCAADMLRMGGRLVYSTCTFAVEENEGSIERFLARHPDFSPEGIPKRQGTANTGTIRLYPHRVKGEGQFAAVLKKAGNAGGNAHSLYGEEAGIAPVECALYRQFAKEFLRRDLSGVFVNYGGQLYLLPKGAPALCGLKVVRAGLHLGTMKKNRFEPAHALSHALKPEDVRLCCDLPGDGEMIRSYLSGGTFAADGENGWYLITVDGFGIGWGKLAGAIMKNHYPKGLRKIL